MFPPRPPACQLLLVRNPRKHTPVSLALALHLQLLLLLGSLVEY